MRTADAPGLIEITKQGATRYCSTAEFDLIRGPTGWVSTERTYLGPTYLTSFQPAVAKFGHSHGTTTGGIVAFWDRLATRLDLGAIDDNTNEGLTDGVSDGTTEVLSAITTEGLYGGQPIVMLITGMGIDALRTSNIPSAATVQANISGQLAALDAGGAQHIWVAKEPRILTTGFNHYDSTETGNIDAFEAAFDAAIAAYSGAARLTVVNLADYKPVLGNSDTQTDHLHPNEATVVGWYELWDEAARASGFAVQPDPPSASIHQHVGGSLTGLDIDGYVELGGTKFSSAGYNIGGGHMKAWATNSPVNYFARLDTQIASRGLPSKVWLQLLCNDTANLAEFEGYATTVVAGIQARCPGATIYVSAMEHYDAATGDCASTFNSMADISAALWEKWVVDEGFFPAGPVISTITAADLVGSDSCHPGPSGQLVHGQAVLEFFG